MASTSPPPPPSGRKKRSSDDCDETTLGERNIDNKRAKQGNSSSSSSSKKGDQNVRVVTRIRPLSTKEINESSHEAIRIVPSLDRSTTITVNTGMSGRSGAINSPKTFDFDGAFGPDTTQAQFYNDAIGDMVTSNIFKGFNVTIMAYGQTGSGKVNFVWAWCAILDLIVRRSQCPAISACVLDLHHGNRRKSVRIQ